MQLAAQSFKNMGYERIMYDHFFEVVTKQTKNCQKQRVMGTIIWTVNIKKY